MVDRLLGTAPPHVSPTTEESRPSPEEDEDEPELPALEVSGAAVREQLGAGQALLFLDVREPSEVAQTGVVRGALHIPLGHLSARHAELPRDRRLIVYCAAGMRSHDAAAWLRSNKGFTDAWSLAGGLPGWRLAGGEVEPR